MQDSRNIVWNVSVVTAFVFAHIANLAIMGLAARGALGPSDPLWFYALAALWPVAGTVATCLVWTHSLSTVVSCLQTVVIFTLTTIGICMNLGTVEQILYVA